MAMYKGPAFNTLKTLILEKRRFIQVLAGPRQTGKSTLARQLMAELDVVSHYATADEPALMTAQWNSNLQLVRKDQQRWGHLIESTLGTVLVNMMKSRGGEVFYWAANNREVDFVLQYRDKLIAIEVKSGARKAALPGMEAFSEIRIVRGVVRFRAKAWGRATISAINGHQRLSDFSWSPGS